MADAGELTEAGRLLERIGKIVLAVLAVMTLGTALATAGAWLATRDVKAAEEAQEERITAAYAAADKGLVEHFDKQVDRLIVVITGRPDPGPPQRPTP